MLSTLLAKPDIHTMLSAQPLNKCSVFFLLYNQQRLSILCCNKYLFFPMQSHIFPMQVRKPMCENHSLLGWKWLIKLVTTRNRFFTLSLCFAFCSMFRMKMWFWFNKHNRFKQNRHNCIMYGRKIPNVTKDGSASLNAARTKAIPKSNKQKH